MEPWQYTPGGPLTVFKTDVWDTPELARWSMNRSTKDAQARKIHAFHSEYEREWQNALHRQKRSILRTISSASSTLSNLDYESTLCDGCEIILRQCGAVDMKSADPNYLIPLALTKDLYETVASKTCGLCAVFLSTLTDYDKNMIRAHKARELTSDTNKETFRTICLLSFEDKMRHLILYHSLPGGVIMKYVSLMKPESS